MECLEEYLLCHQEDRALDPVALQGEVLALKARLRGAEREVRELSALAAAAGVASRGRAPGGGRGASAGEGGGGAAAVQQQYVPVSALQALERAHGESEQAQAALRAAMVGARMRHAVAREALVGHVERIR